MRAEIMDAPGVGGLGGTYNGNPVACAAALAVLDMVREQNLCGRAKALGDAFVSRCEKWRQTYPLVGEVHGLGAMRATPAACPGATSWTIRRNCRDARSRRRSPTLEFQGFFAHEFVPLRDPMTSLREAVQLCTV